MKTPKMAEAMNYIDDDLVAGAIFEQMKKEGSEHVWLSLAPIPEEHIKSHFPHIYQHCLDEGYDVTKEPIPVVPSQDYFMGGIDVNSVRKPLWIDCAQLAKPLATVSMAGTVWPATLFWRAWFLPSVLPVTLRKLIRK